MWILTQQGKAVNTDKLNVIDTDNDRDNPLDIVGIVGKSRYNLGTYESSFHCKEVIKYIVAAIKKKQIVLEMPDEWPLGK